MIENTIEKKEQQEIAQISRRHHLAENIVIVDGQGGCGKTMLAPIVAALDRVELLTYAYELEQICYLRYLEKIDHDAAVGLVRMFTDLQLYNAMMGREINFRPSDISSVFSDVRPWRYFRRLFMKGDAAVPERITQERPILLLTTHNLLSVGDLLFCSLGQRLSLVDSVRHPLYMVKQLAINMEAILDTPRNFTTKIRYNDKDIPYFAYGWEDLFVRSNPTEKAVYKIRHFTRTRKQKKKELSEKYGAKIVTIPFEQFVVNPWSFLDDVTKAVDSRITRKTHKMLRKQNVPRKKYADGIGLKVYKRCGWTPPKAHSTEEDEFASRRQYVAENVSKEALDVIDQLSIEYEQEYLGGKLQIKGR